MKNTETISEVSARIAELHRNYAAMILEDILGFVSGCRNARLSFSLLREGEAYTGLPGHNIYDRRGDLFIPGYITGIFMEEDRMYVRAADDQGMMDDTFPADECSLSELEDIHGLLEQVEKGEYLTRSDKDDETVIIEKEEQK